MGWCNCVADFFALPLFKGVVTQISCSVQMVYDRGVRFAVLCAEVWLAGLCMLKCLVWEGLSVFLCLRYIADIANGHHRRTSDTAAREERKGK